MKKSLSLPVIIGVLILWMHAVVFAQTTGKIAGMVTDANSKEPLAGANVFIEGTSLGSAVGIDGTFYIINVPAGTYDLTVDMIGYESKKFTDLRVSVNRTVTLDIELHPSILEGEVIVVQADKIATRKDQTGSIRTVSSEQMQVLPIENVNDIVQMQAGVVDGHFRGGRLDEVSYLVDGLPVNDAFGGVGQNVQLEAEAVEDLEVITGNFNAEYGRAMSGVVNYVTKDGGKKISASASASAASYVTPHDDIFIGVNESFPRNQDYKLQLSGPLVLDDLSFIFNTRFQENKNYLNGIRRFNTNDYSSFTNYPDYWYSENSGDGAYVPMNDSRNLSVMGKLAYNLMSNIKISLLYTYNHDKWRGYNHIYKYDPDGMASSYRETDMYLFQLNHSLGNSAFYELKLSYLDNYDGWYLFRDPTDPGYISDIFLGNNTETGFYTGGQEKGHSETYQKDINAKLDLVWQVNNRHALKSGILFTHHHLQNYYSQIRNLYEAEAELWVPSFDEFGRLVPPPYAPVVYPDSSSYSDFYDVYPIEFSAYLQDKMEYEDMVLNVGLRFDYFDPKTVYPSQRRNPANQLHFDDLSKMSGYPKATQQQQISPRISFAYQLGSKALLRFSYGHFFQMPPMYAIYQNNSFLVVPTDYATTMGNAEVKPQKTVQYEVGLSQEVVDGMHVDVALYYRDIYNLLSAVVYSTYNQIEYGLYSNKDYGNAKGLDLTLDYRLGSFQSTLNYTLQYTRGNADNPTMTFDRAGASQDPVPKLIPMSWDQRHTLNLTVGYYQPQWGVAGIGFFNSGTPYTWTPLSESILSRVNLYPNNAYKPAMINVDMRAYYKIDFIGDTKINLMLNIYNLFDRLNEVWVNGTTGRAYSAIIRASDEALHRSNFNVYLDRVHDPSSYSAPRMIKFGIGLEY
jgi:outer membrane receptor for ferrienterochelin and colicin